MPRRARRASLSTTALRHQLRRQREAVAYGLELLERRTLFSVTVGTNFGGLDNSYTPWGPLDPNGAVGPNYVCQIINTDLAVFTKSGQLVEEHPFSALAAWTKNDPYGPIDPYIVFDPLAQRWVFTAGLTEVYFAVSNSCLLYTSPSPRDGLLSRMPSSA